MSLVIAQRRALKSALTQLASQPRWLIWVYLALITSAELLTTFVSLHLGQLMHMAVLLALIAQSVYGDNYRQRALALALTLAPLTRLLSLSLPLSALPPLLWYPMVGGPLLLAAWLVIRSLELSARQLGLGIGRPVSQLLFAAGGLGLGAAEFAILSPKQLITPTSLEGVALVGVLLTISIGLVEELIFRGLLQCVAWRVMGWVGAVYVALLFAVLHIGYRSMTDLFFVFAVGILFAHVVERGGSLLGVTIAHGLANLTLYVICPLLTELPSLAPAGTLRLLSWGGSLLGVAGLVMLSLGPHAADDPGL